MATVNPDGSPHNTPYFFMHSPDLTKLYWGSHPDSQHSQNILQTGQVFVVLYEAMERGGLYIQADGGHIAEGEELVEALQTHNERRQSLGKEPIPIEYYQTGPQHMWVAQTRQFWVNNAERDANGHVLRDIRIPVDRTALL